MRKSLLVATGLAMLIGIVVAVVLLLPERTAPKPGAVTPIASAPESKSAQAAKPTAPPEKVAAPTQAASPSLSTNRTVAREPVSSAERQLLAELAEISNGQNPISREQAEKFKKNLEELVRRGAASIPAIREFLDKNVDTYYNEVTGGDQLSYSSLRAALFDTLKQIGGPEAQGAMVQVLQTSAVPGELLEIAKNLEVEAPGQYREQILKAAREALEMASSNQLGTNAELGPAYRILNSYSEAGAAEDTAKLDPINFSNALAMANLPDGQGLQTLIQMAQNPSPDASGKIVATEMIAQLAGNNAQAFEALMQMAQNAQISNRVWTRLAPILAGDQYQVGAAEGAPDGNVSAAYTIVNNVTTFDQINQRIALIDRFLAVISPDSAASSALLHERQLLTMRLSN